MNTVSYTPARMSTMLSSVIAEAVPALLDQHDKYDLNHLESYLEGYYPEIPSQLREVVITAATLGARRAALLHSVWEKNKDSLDPEKRRFAGEAASSLSFWALGLRPAYRSGVVRPIPNSSVCVSSASPVTVAQSPVAASRSSAAITSASLPTFALSYSQSPQMLTVQNNLSADLSASVAEAVPQSQSVQYYPMLSMAISDVQLPVPLTGCDKEFDRLYAELSPISEAPLTGEKSSLVPAQQQEIHHLQDESKDQSLVIAVSDGDDLDDVESSSPVPPVPSSKPPSRQYSVGKIRKRASTGMPSNLSSPLVALLAKPAQGLKLPTPTTSSQGTTPAATSSPMTSTPRKRASHQITMSDDEWLQFQQFRKK